MEMFELQSKTIFEHGFCHAVVFMNRENHASKFEVIFKADETGKMFFYYENNVCLTNDERMDFENWFMHEV